MWPSRFRLLIPVLVSLFDTNLDSDLMKVGYAAVRVEFSAWGANGPWTPSLCGSAEPKGGPQCAGIVDASDVGEGHSGGR